MKKVVIGIDVSKETIDATVIIPSQTGSKVIPVFYKQYENRPRGFRSLVSDVRKQACGLGKEEWLFCCETIGAYDYSLCYYMCSKSLDIWRESALRIRNSRGLQLGKSDKADSMTIADYAYRHLDKAKPFVLPDEDIKSIKELYRYRESLVSEMSAKKVRAKEIKATAIASSTVNFIYKDSMKEVERLEKSIKACEDEIKKIIEANEEIKRNYDHITTIKGVSFVTATGLIAFTNNFRSIDNSRSASRYIGSACLYEDSGTSVHKRVDTRNYCNSMLKCKMTLAARSAIDTNATMKSYAERLRKRGKTEKIIINNVRNKLLHTIYSLVAHDQDFEENHEYKLRKGKEAA